jgi:hypothetical protein
MNKKIINKMQEKELKVVRVTKEEYELENGDIFPHIFNFEEDITIEEFQTILNSSKNMVLSHLKNINNE